ncbi:MAG: methyltransferase domain-containing protein [Bacteroidetes bacterium]|nr:MAG: methyltransferase domain-containing protein [Bacteroidota bacterium]
MVELKDYNQDFYADQQVSSLGSAKALLPIINEMFKPKSVVDVGCGIGAWLQVWNNSFGITDYFGIEAPFILKEMLIVNSDKVLFTDLNREFKIGRHFDIAMCLEVAEHIEPSGAKQFVANLAMLSDVVIFSAAIPGQEGTFHVNEQWPEYWAEKFADNGFVPVDAIRKLIWRDERINYWYRQNMIIFVKRERLLDYPQLAAACQLTDPDFLTRIHPDLLAYKTTIVSQLNSPLGYWRKQGYFAKVWIKNRIKRL